ncbi:hypothetical protein MCOR03_002341 [Pyricularia oryzae]|nr:hypothetical protein MCOR05_005840 [Pyricularia oryzae]KAI6537048.1 hypothetical protein MCOR10_001807 [Pyricularia oryzae]KAI6564601.1 hypothetical protein MCOR03_002341 [Pyricularia oryzae]
METIWCPLWRRRSGSITTTWSQSCGKRMWREQTLPQLKAPRSSRTYKDKIESGATTPENATSRAAHTSEGSTELGLSVGDVVKLSPMAGSKAKIAHGSECRAIIDLDKRTFTWPQN